MDPNLLKLTQIYHQERLQEAAQALRFRECGRLEPGLKGQILLHLGKLFIALGQKLKGQSTSATVRPAF